jgi:DnaD/phage-associated family protein
MRYVEKAAYTWEREGIFTLDKAEAYLKALDVRRSVRGEMKNALHIRDRELSSTEQRYVDGWTQMGFSPESVEIAYDRTLVKTGKLAWNYMDSIIKSWHQKGLHTPAEIQDKDSRPAAEKAAGGVKSKAEKFGATSPEEFERMKRRLEKIKEE